VDTLAADRTGNDLHGAVLVVAPGADLNPRHAAESGGKQCRVPGEQPIARHRGIATGGGVEHHLDHALDVPVDRRQCANVHTESTGDRRSHRCGVEPLAFDFAGFKDVLGECGKAGLVTQGHADVG
jgi:hypothetical protein